jgi:hypothetical protein
MRYANSELEMGNGKWEMGDLTPNFQIFFPNFLLPRMTEMPKPASRLYLLWTCSIRYRFHECIGTKCGKYLKRTVLRPDPIPSFGGIHFLVAQAHRCSSNWWGLV